MDTGNIALPSTTATGRTRRITTRLEGLEAVETGAGRFHAYRVAVAVTYDDGNVLPWTDWYAGDRLLVKRVISSPRQGGGALTSPEQTLRLEEFTPGR